MREHQVGFFILADEEPTINRKKFIALCEELIKRDLPVKWGINTRVTDILRDRELLPMFRKAGLVHVSLGTEAAAQLKLDRFRKETTIEQNKLAIKLIKDAGMVAEAQFIMGLENETPETIEETYKLAQDWKPDMANWNMYTPWPFAELFEELGDKVEVRDYAKYNFVTPIIQPDEMTRDEVLKGVLKNYARFYMLKSFLSYPWQRDSFKRKYLMGCLKAFAKTTWTKKFYDLERLKFNGVNAEWDLGFDESKVLNGEQIAALKRDRPDLEADVDYKGKGKGRFPGRRPAKVMACGGGVRSGAVRDVRGAGRTLTGMGGAAAAVDSHAGNSGSAGRIGPNAVIRLAEALRARAGNRPCRADLQRRRSRRLAARVAAGDGGRARRHGPARGTAWRPRSGGRGAASRPTPGN